ncbi:MAG: DnaJ domain-containing protein [Proteobacteria bacterium]|nr:DnaJ domain-containing protein [Pseudomonadota bacterium]
MHQRDYYTVLNIEKSASASEIKNAYRELALKYHPDRNRDNPDSLEKMKEINEAYAVLSNPSRRKEYDSLKTQLGAGAHDRFRQSYSDQDIFKGSDINHIIEEMAKAFGLRGFDDLFKDVYGKNYHSFEFNKKGVYAKGFFFSSGFPGNKNRQGLPEFKPSGVSGKIVRYLLNKMTGGKLPEKGNDRHDSIRIEKEMAKKGGPYAYYLKEKSKKLVITVPPGIREGQKIRLSGMGEDGKNEGAPGDLYLKVQFDKPAMKWLKDVTGHLFKK